MYIRKVIMDKNCQFDREYYSEIPTINSLQELRFNKNITFFVGENGTGKSTLLEAIAIQYGFNPEGGSINFSFSSKNTHSKLYEHITLVKEVKRPKDGFFLRAESFYNVASEIDNLNDSANIFLQSYGGKSLHNQSHGESFLSLIQNRFRGNGLYILDEPEAALSPQKLLTIIILINELVDNNSQFIIATHSPILLGMPNSEIYSFNNDSIEPIDYEDTEHYLITKSFLNNRQKFLGHLFD